MLVLDRSGSIRQNPQDQLVEIREDAGRLVRHLPPATRVFVRFISERSYQDAELLSGIIPEETPPLRCQPFDPRCRQAELQRKAQLHCVSEAHERLAAALQNLTNEMQFTGPTLCPMFGGECTGETFVGYDHLLGFSTILLTIEFGLVATDLKVPYSFSISCSTAGE